MTNHRYIMRLTLLKTFVHRGFISIRNNKRRTQFRQCSVVDILHQSQELMLRLVIETWFARANRSSLTLFLCNKWKLDDDPV